MTAFDWLRERAPGFDSLSAEEIEAMTGFALLWGFFESQALREKASVAAISEYAKARVSSGRLEVQSIAEQLQYFRQRYYSGGQPTAHFAHLQLRKTDQPKLVSEVLSGAKNDPIECATVALLIAYRYRNNLFHGMKWAYGVGGQLSNFRAASIVIMRALE